MAIMENFQGAAIKQAYACLDKEPDANIPRLMNPAGKPDVFEVCARQRAAVRL